MLFCALSILQRLDGIDLMGETVVTMDTRLRNSDSKSPTEECRGYSVDAINTDFFCVLNLSDHASFMFVCMIKLAVTLISDIQ